MVSFWSILCLFVLLPAFLSCVLPVLCCLTHCPVCLSICNGPQDTVLALEAVTDYSLKLSKADLNMDIAVQYTEVPGKDIRTDVKITTHKPVASTLKVPLCRPPIGCKRLNVPMYLH